MPPLSLPHKEIAVSVTLNKDKNITCFFKNCQQFGHGQTKFQGIVHPGLTTYLHTQYKLDQ